MDIKTLIDGIDGLAATGDLAMPISGLAADSRKIAPGVLFAALPSADGSAARDGRDFIFDALSAGAAALLLPEDTRLPEGLPPGLPIIFAARPRRAMAQLAARLAPGCPQHVVAITGTNGKSSIASFCRQIWHAMGREAASLGTLGVTAHLPEGGLLEENGRLTTPDPAALHQTLSRLAQAGITHLAMEASSQGLDQHRSDAVPLMAAGFSNLTRDHLDYHKDMAAYLDAKLRLFREILPAGAAAVLNRDMPEYDAVRAVCTARGQNIIDISLSGDGGALLRLDRQDPRPDGQDLSFSLLEERFDIHLPLIGRFQAFNALMALALVISEDIDNTAFRRRAVAALSGLTCVRGRLEQAALLNNGATVYVDYAHTPDGLETMLRAVRPHAAGRLHVVIGCGGDRDPGKRAPMGRIAAACADLAIITDDNPRSENAASIRQQMMAGVDDSLRPRVRAIGDRRAAIAAALDDLGPGDVLVVAGKGHEQGQIIGEDILPFDDLCVIRAEIDRRNDTKNNEKRNTKEQTA